MKEEKLSQMSFFLIILCSCKRKESFPKEKERVLHHHPVI